MATSFVALHVAPYAESLAASVVRAFEGFLAGMTVTVYSQTTGPRERLVACRADVAILGLRERSV